MSQRTSRSTSPRPTWRGLLLGGWVLAGCGGHTNVAGGPAGDASPAASTPAPAVAPVPACAAGCTLVVAIAPSVTTPIVLGPFTVTSINPGGGLELAMATDAACAQIGTGWFEYSGGGVSVGSDQTLCARSSADAVIRHGFSGHRPDVSIR